VFRAVCTLSNNILLHVNDGAQRHSFLESLLVDKCSVVLLSIYEMSAFPDIKSGGNS
jgi:hypothetical protein